MTVSFHLFRVHPGRVPGVALRSLTNRRGLARVPGLRFSRTLGTGDGSRMTRGAELTRWAFIAVWDSPADLHAFTQTPQAPERAAGLQEAWRGEFEVVAAHGAWGGHRPFRESDLVDDPGGPLAVLTRATIPMRHWRAFTRAVPPVDRQLHDQPGLLAAVGIGERPIGLQATFSLWRDAAAIRAFAYSGAHSEVVGATRRHGWFKEECFARLTPTASWGTWDGSDPLASAFTGQSIP